MWDVYWQENHSISVKLFNDRLNSSQYVKFLCLLYAELFCFSFAIWFKSQLWYLATHSTGASWSTTQVQLRGLHPIGSAVLYKGRLVRGTLEEVWKTYKEKEGCRCLVVIVCFDWEHYWRKSPRMVNWGVDENTDGDMTINNCTLENSGKSHGEITKRGMFCDSPK